MREKTIEQELVKEVERVGGMCPKFISPGMNGMPDRLLLLPEGKAAFVEVKAPGEKPRALQVVRHKELLSLGYKVYVLDDAGKIPEILEDMRNG